MYTPDRRRDRIDDSRGGFEEYIRSPAPPKTGGYDDLLTGARNSYNTGYRYNQGYADGNAAQQQ